MKKEDKIEYLISHHSIEWLKTKNRVFEELSNNQSIFCCCGKLATGLHERQCRKFQSKVETQTIRELKHLLPL